jgi:hypothetical protein
VFFSADANAKMIQNKWLNKAIAGFVVAPQETILVMKRATFLLLNYYSAN